MPAALLVNPLEIRMFEQSRRAGKICSRPRCNLLFTPARSVGAHNLKILHNG